MNRVLAVADWSVDPGAVADALAAAGDGERTAFGFLVPARLPGLAWIGDPNASRPCAERQLAELERLARERGLTVEVATVGDPERLAAITTSLETWDADRISLFDRRPRRLARRLERKTGRPVRTRLLPALRQRCNRF
jgi:hypothetical protein